MVDCVQAINYSDYDVSLAKYENSLLDEVYANRNAEDYDLSSHAISTVHNVDSCTNNMETEDLDLYDALETELVNQIGSCHIHR
jgi:hypothetical protein